MPPITTPNLSLYFVIFMDGSSTIFLQIMVLFNLLVSGLIVEEVHATKPLCSHTPANVKRVITICSIPLLSHVTDNVRIQQFRQIFDAIEKILTRFRLICILGALGMDCANLGLGLTNTSTSRPDSSPSSANVDTSHGEITSLKYAWLISMVTTLTLALWKNT
ncbi:hypothetical protein ACJIZ3_013840 [Penstemon smallii]|uniref:Uncharacterized protein n=1 Tax=Penstemon smallii TaxID=265156 RepID=A0ABD3RJS0_9LAMI